MRRSRPPFLAPPDWLPVSLAVMSLIGTLVILCAWVLELFGQHTGLWLVSDPFVMVGFFGAANLLGWVALVLSVREFRRADRHPGVTGFIPVRRGLIIAASSLLLGGVFLVLVFWWAY